MPSTRRSRNSAGPATKGSQKILAFSNTTITKPTSSSANKSLNEKPTVIAPTSTTLDHVVPSPSVEAKSQTDDNRVERKPTAEEARAEHVTEAQIRKYWHKKEAERTAPRVHQGNLSVEEKILRLFDVSSQYGPCIGIARLKRWERANKLGLTPPIEVLAVLLKEERRGNAKIDRAHVDELMSSKFLVGEA